MAPSSPIKPVAVLLAGLLCACVRGGVLDFTPADAKLAYGAAAGLVRDCTPRNAGTPEGLRAAEWIVRRSRELRLPSRLDRFRAQVYADQVEFANVVAEFPGTDPDAPWIVLMSHFDTAPTAAKGFEGANDGASTCGLLMALGCALRRAPRVRENVMLVWTDAEECRIAYMPRDGFQGSKRLLETVRTRRLPVKAVVCLDMLGDRDLNIVIPANTTPGLRDLALAAARTAGVADKVARRDTIVVKDDHSAFFDAGYPAIDLIDFEFGSAPGKNDYWHTPKDTMDKISERSLLASGRLAAELLNLLVNLSPGGVQVRRSR